MHLAKKLLPPLSLAALAAILGLAIALLAGAIERPTLNAGLLAASILWFATAPFWIARE